LLHFYFSSFTKVTIW